MERDNEKGNWHSAAMGSRERGALESEFSFRLTILNVLQNEILYTHAKNICPNIQLNLKKKKNLI